MSASVFQSVLTEQYRHLFEHDPAYAGVAESHTPEGWARHMTQALRTSTGNKDGAGIKRTCRLLGVRYTYGAIFEYLNKEGAP